MLKVGDLAFEVDEWIIRDRVNETAGVYFEDKTGWFHPIDNIKIDDEGDVILTAS